MTALAKSPPAALPGGAAFAVLTTCVAYAVFNINDAALKMVSAKFHFSQIMFLNSCLVILFFGLYGWLREGRRAFQTRKPWHIALRACLAQVVTLCNIAALPHVPLTTFYTLVFMSPMLVALLSALFLGDRLGARRLGIILAGFAVVAWVFQPGGSGNVPLHWMLLVLLGATAYSAQLVVMRSLGAGESRILMVLAGSAGGLIVAAPFLLSHFIMPTPYEWGLFAIMGIMGAIGLLCIAYGFQIAPSAAAVAPCHYTQIVWAALLGWYIFHEVPEARVMTGAGAIILLGLYLIFSETRRALAPDAEKGIET